MTFVLSLFVAIILNTTTIFFSNLWIIISGISNPLFHPMLAMTGLTAFSVVMILFLRLCGETPFEGHWGFGMLPVWATNNVMCLMRSDGATGWLLIPALLYLVAIWVYAYRREYTKNQLIVAIVISIIFTGFALSPLPDILLPQASVFPFMH